MACFKLTIKMKEHTAAALCKYTDINPGVPHTQQLYYEALTCQGWACLVVPLGDEVVHCAGLPNELKDALVEAGEVGVPLP